jgi:hypothetical protein
LILVFLDFGAKCDIINYLNYSKDTKIRKIIQQISVSIKQLPKTNLLLVLAWVFVVLGAAIATTYVVAQETLDVTAEVPGVTPPGGGGGSSGSTTGSTAVMSGWAFPSAKLTLLKDGAVSTTLIANPNGSFQITLNNLHNGPYQLAIFAEDPNGTISSSHVINLLVNNNQTYNFTNIIIPPTISANPTSVSFNASYTVAGYAPAGSSVAVSVPNLNTTVGTATADSNGYYQLNLLGNLPPGVQALRARATLNGFTSLYSRPVLVQFYLPGEVPIPPPPPQLGICVDYNRDRRVNLIDFSILLFWFGKPAAPPTIDCNRDRAIDIKDFSILMYFWTG